MRLGVGRRVLRRRRLLIRGGRPGLRGSSARGNSVKEIGGHQNRTRKEGIGRSHSRENQHPGATSIIRIKGSESDEIIPREHLGQGIEVLLICRVRVGILQAVRHKCAQGYGLALHHDRYIP